MVAENTVAGGTAENTVGHTAMVDTKGQTAETKPTAINKELQPKTKWEAEPEDVIHPPERGGLENKIVNQLIIPTTVPPTYLQVVNTTISLVDKVE